MKIRDIMHTWVSWDSPDTITVTETALDGRVTSRTEMSAVELLESDLADREVSRFGSHGRSPEGAWSHYFEIVPVTRPDLHIERRIVRMRLQRAVCAYAREYLQDLSNKEKEDAAVKAMKEAPDDGEIKVMLLTAESNMKVMIGCIRDLLRAVDVLSDPEEDVDDWMLAGITAMLDKVNEMKIIPYDLPESICGLLEVDYRTRKGEGGAK